MEEMQAQAEHVGTKVVWDHIAEVDLSRRPFRLTGDGGTDLSADTLVIATGAQAQVARPAVRGAYEGHAARRPARPATAFSTAARRSR